MQNVRQVLLEQGAGVRRLQGNRSLPIVCHGRTPSG
jgi:hypothetical protein